MKWKIAAMALCSGLVAGPAGAQVPSTGAPAAGRTPEAPSLSPSGPTDEPTSTPPASRTYSATDLPGPRPVEEIKPPTIALPDDPLEPYLLTKANGPFMVMAKVFRGPDAERLALALCKELRQDFGLPAYILRSKEFPMKSYIRGTPVQAPSETMKSAIKQPEQVRIHDEAAVLVGDEKTLQGSEDLLHKVKKLKPKCLKGIPGLYPWRSGDLSRAIRTTNPYVPAQWLYPKTPDRLMVQMNDPKVSPRSIANCPGHYTIQVAMFTGRSAFDLYGKGMETFKGLIDPRSSPLQSAHDDAERLANKLSKTPEILQLGQPVFVYHDRTTSRVYVGSFQSPDDPSAAVVRGELVKLASTFNSAGKDWRGRPVADHMIVPATMVTNADDLKQTIR